MDTLAHALFSGALRKKVGKKPLTKKSFFAALFWGAFPDLFAFWPIYIGVLMSGGFTWGRTYLGIDSRSLYELSHSLVVVLAVFCLIFLIWRFLLKRSFPYVMLGWPLHILFDMPTHAPDRYPTPFLYPISDWTLPFGLPWSTPWFWILTWIIIILVYVYFFWQSRRSVF